MLCLLNQHPVAPFGVTPFGVTLFSVIMSAVTKQDFYF
jgi:hypothetical protein